MEAKHTPGPWRVVQRETLEDGSIYPAHIVGGGADYEVCQIESALIAGMKERGEIRGTPIGDRTNDANAKLLAAAPELLDALRAAYSDIQRLPGHTIDMLGRIEAAIAKATP